MILNKKLKIFGILILILVLTIASFEYSLAKKYSGQNLMLTTTLYLKSLSWPTYRDNELGISFKYPPESIKGKITVFRIEDVLFIVPETSPIYLKKDELSHFSGKSLLTAASTIDDYGYWAILVGTAAGEEDLEAIIQEKFLEFNGGCKFGGFEEQNSDLYHVKIIPRDGNFEPDGSCFINYQVGFIYSPRFHRAAIWNMGQTPNFYLSRPARDDFAADEIMFESFKLIQTDN